MTVDGSQPVESEKERSERSVWGNVQAVVTVLSPFGSIIAWQFTDDRIPLAIAVGFSVVLAGAFAWWLRRRTRFSAGVVIAWIIFTLIAWIVFALPKIDNEEPPVGGNDPTDDPLVTTEDDDPFEATHVTSLCAEPPDVTNSWFLYETSGAPSKIVIEQDGSAVAHVDGSAFSAAGSRLVYVDPTLPSRVVLEDVATHERVATTVLEGRVTDTTISQDGETVVLIENRSGDTRLVLWRPSTDDREVLYDPRADVSAPALSPAGDRLAWVEGEPSSGEVLIADLPAFATRTVVKRGADPAWSPDGDSIVYTTRRSGEGTTVYAVAAGGGEPLKLTNPVQADDSDPVVLPSCDGVAFARAEDGSVDLWQRMLDGDSDAILRELTGAQSRPAFATE